MCTKNVELNPLGLWNWKNAGSGGPLDFSFLHFFFVRVHVNAKEIRAHFDASCYLLARCSVSACLMCTDTAQTFIFWPRSDSLAPCSATASCHYVAQRSRKEDSWAGMWMGRMCTWHHVCFRPALPPIHQPGGDAALTWISHRFETQNMFGQFMLKLSLASVCCQKWEFLEKYNVHIEM